MQFSLKYRPIKFSEVVGQPVATKILANSIRMDRVPTALILFGMHGCGKTTLARLYAKSLNCADFDGEPCCVCPSCRDIHAGSSQSVFEYDAASHSGADDARALKDLVAFEVHGAYRVIILDECHMLTKQAQAALLKLIEEPPPKTLFILVTTDVASLESTILSRCLKIDVRPIGAVDIEQNIERCLTAEGVQYTQGFVTGLARQAQGSVRDTQQILEQLVVQSDGELTEDLLNISLGLISVRTYKDMAYALNTRNAHEFLKVIQKWYTQGIDLADLFTNGIPRLVHDFILCLADADGADYYTGIKKTTLTQNLCLTYPEVKDILRAWDIHIELMRETTWPKIVWDAFAISVCNT